MVQPHDNPLHTEAVHCVVGNHNERWPLIWSLFMVQPHDNPLHIEAVHCVVGNHYELWPLIWSLLMVQPHDNPLHIEAVHCVVGNHRPLLLRFENNLIFLKWPAVSVADADPGSVAFLPFWPLDPGSGMGKKSGPGSGKNNQDHISESLETIFMGWST